MWDWPSFVNTLIHLGFHKCPYKVSYSQHTTSAVLCCPKKLILVKHALIKCIYVSNVVQYILNYSNKFNVWPVSMSGRFISQEKPLLPIE